MIRSTDCLFLWDGFIAIELSAVSNGWFRYLLDNKLATMYSSGSIESGPDPYEGRDELVDKIRRCCALVPEGTPLNPVLSTPSPMRLEVGNWTLVCQREGEVDIFNSEGAQVDLAKCFNTHYNYINNTVCVFLADHDPSGEV